MLYPNLKCDMIIGGKSSPNCNFKTPKTPQKINLNMGKPDSI